MFVLSLSRSFFYNFYVVLCTLYSQRFSFCFTSLSHHRIHVVRYGLDELFVCACARAWVLINIILLYMRIAKIYIANIKIYISLVLWDTLNLSQFQTLIHIHSQHSRITIDENNPAWRYIWTVEIVMGVMTQRTDWIVYFKEFNCLDVDLEAFNYGDHHKTYQLSWKKKLKKKPSQVHQVNGSVQWKPFANTHVWWPINQKQTH